MKYVLRMHSTLYTHDTIASMRHVEVISLSAEPSIRPGQMPDLSLTTRILFKELISVMDMNMILMKSTKLTNTITFRMYPLTC